MSLLSDLGTKIGTQLKSKMGIDSHGSLQTLNIKSNNMGDTTDLRFNDNANIASNASMRLLVDGSNESNGRYIDFGYGSYNSNGYTSMMRLNDDGLGIPNNLSVGGSPSSTVMDYTQVYVKKGAGSKNLQRWGEGDENTASSYRFRIDQNYNFIGNNGTTDTIMLESSSGNVSIKGDLKMNGSDSYIWTNGTGTGYTGIYDPKNSFAPLTYRESDKTLNINSTNGSVIIGNTSKAIDNVVEMRVSSTNKNHLKMTSAGQGSAEITLQQEDGHGFGLLYNADDNPNELEGGDWSVFYKQSNSVKSTMFGWHHADNFVTFKQTPKVNGSPVMTGNKTISTSAPSGGAEGDLWIQV